MSDVQQEPIWPRWAVEINGRGRARFDCWGDVPRGWKLEDKIPGEKKIREKPIEEPAEEPKTDPEA